MKKILIICFTLLVLILTFSSCGKKEKWSLDESLIAKTSANERMDECAFEKALADRKSGKLSCRVSYSPYSEDAGDVFGMYFNIKDGDEKLGNHITVLQYYENDEDIGNTEKATYVSSVDGTWNDKDNLVFNALKNGTPFALCRAGEIDPLTHTDKAIYFITEDGYELYGGEEVENPEQYFKNIYMIYPKLTDLAE